MECQAVAASSGPKPDGRRKTVFYDALSSVRLDRMVLLIGSFERGRLSGRVVAYMYAKQNCDATGFLSNNHILDA